MKSKSDITKENILKTSQKLFKLHGFEKTTTRMISTELEMSTGSLFVHFKSKREILVNLLYSKIEKAITKGFKSATKQNNLDDKIIKIFEPVFEFYFSNQGFSKELLKGVLFEPNEMILIQAQDFNKKIQNLIEDSTETGEILPRKDSATLAGIIFSVYFMILLKEICYEQKASKMRAMTELRGSFDLLF
jgi:AcrR family transcriptional regulator